MGSQNEPALNSSWKSTALGWFLFLLVLGFAFYLANGKSNEDRTHTNLEQDLYQLKALALAVFNFHDTRKQFPFCKSQKSKLNPRMSWRTIVSPYVEQRSFYDNFDFDQPWDTEKNKRNIELFGHCFRLSNSNLISGIRQSADFHSFSSVVDGHEFTIMLIENPELKWRSWTQPNDPTIDEAVEWVMNIKPGESLIAVSFAGEAIRIQSPFRSKLTRSQLRSAFDPMDGEQFDLSLLE